MLTTLSQFIARYLPFDAVAQEVAAGGVGAAFLFLVGLTTRYGRHLYLRVKFPVGGSFTTFFEDVENGKVVPRSCSSTLRQRGLAITGVTKLSSGRTWTLKGHLIGGRHVAGVYSANDPADQGVGSFYLQFDNGDLDGVWTGYDHINKRTTTGRYSFKRLRRVRIKRYQAQHRAAVLDILAATFGQGYLSDVDKAAAEDKSITYVALDGRRVCAFGYAYLASAGALANIARGLDPRFTPALRDADGKGTLGVIQTLAVEPSVQGRGVGTQMLTSLEEYLWRQEATAIIVPAWQRQTGVTVAGLLKASGYVAWGSALQYWRAACDRDEFQCPDRGSTCVCDAVFYRKTLAR